MLTALVTLALLGVGGLVTSHGVGMAVPDWPNTYGYNMFLFPISKWVGGIWYEHLHRLIGMVVGLLTSILGGWIWVRETRGRDRWLGVAGIALVVLLLSARKMPVYYTLAALGLAGIVFFSWKARGERGSLRWLGMVAVSAVVLQGVLGGLRVVWFADQIGIFHAMLAQLFFTLVCALVLFTSKWWQERGLRISNSEAGEEATRGVRYLVMGTTFLILIQLALGATMRHQHAGLAIPDFPLAYGRAWPALDADSVQGYNQRRVEVVAANPITATQIALQMAHRIVAVLILAGVILAAWSARRLAGDAATRRLTWVWVGAILLQVLLGAVTIWSNKAADIATGHVLLGAVSLALGTLIGIISFRNPTFGVPVHAPMPATV